MFTISRSIIGTGIAVIGIVGLGVFLVLAQWGSNLARAQQQYVLDHFKCYEAKGESADDLVFLQDQFGQQRNTFERDVVRRSRIFCNPTKKFHQGQLTSIEDISAHLTWYDITAALPQPFQPLTVFVTNQLVPNGEALRVLAPRFLAVPTQKLAVNGQQTELGTPQGLDHYKCYQVEAKRLNQQPVGLWDQFSQQNPADPTAWKTSRLVKARYLCNPTAKARFFGFHEEGGPKFESVAITHPQDHLVCYGVVPSGPVNRKLLVNNQFGTEQNLTTLTESLLCVPSQKFLTPIETTKPTVGN